VQDIAEWPSADLAALIRDIAAAGEPAVIRSLVGHWPAVEQGRQSAAAICRYLANLYNDLPVYTIAAPPDAGGRFFYTDDLKRVNFKRGQVPLGQVLQQLLDQAEAAAPHTIAVQALSVRDALPGFEDANPLGLFDAPPAPTLWLGNRGKVAPHYDVHRNIACVVAGRRQFILYPPGQVANLYPGPVLETPGGVPVSLVDPWHPDLDRYPRYAAADKAARQAVLEPGDAIYIPSLWWHGVASLDAVNVLVNYWWGGMAAHGVSPNDSLMHAMLTIAGLDARQQQAWRDYFDYFVFRTGDRPDAHLPAGLADLLTSMTDEQARNLRQFLSRRLADDS